MLDRLANIPDYHFASLCLSASQRMLCLAPHPDDEVLGCAGLLVLAQRQGVDVQSIIVTAGEQGLTANAGNPRLHESLAAAQVLGLPQPQCWLMQDRQLRYTSPLIDRIAATLEQFQPHWLLLPALTEPHPDHQVLALAGMAAAQRLHGHTDVLFYEVGTPTQPNTLVDITTVADLKWQALQAFGSQEARHPYCSHAQSMAALRAFGAGPGVQAAEAFWHLPASALAEPGATATMAFWPLQRQTMQLATDTTQLPLVSIMIRSMNRPSLTQAVASVVEQTYPHIEIVIVNASGAAHPVPPYPPERLNVRVVDPDTDPDTPAMHESLGFLPRLSRSSAANLGLRASSGDYALFLDDDDLLGPLHVHNLVQALQGHSQAIAAYTGVRVEGHDGQWIRDYDLPWQPHRLRGINHLPIHAVLFRRDAVLAASVQFDPALPVLEDWDFWCQLSHLGDFVHVPGISAVYRQGLGTSNLGNLEHPNHWAKWHQQVLEIHARRWGSSAQSTTLAWHALALDHAERETQSLGLQLQQTREQCAQTQTRMTEALRLAEQEIAQLHQQISHEQQTHAQMAATLQQQLQAELDLAQRSLSLLQQSRPVRWGRKLRRLLGQG